MFASCDPGCVVTEVPKTWLRFEEPAGSSSFADSAGSNNGACTAAACPGLEQKGQLGLAAEFDGADDVLRLGSATLVTADPRVPAQVREAGCEVGLETIRVAA